MSEIRSPADIRIRVAGGDDAVPVRELARITFVEAFRDDNDPDEIDTYVAEAFSVERVEAELADPDTVFLIASAGGKDVGYAKIASGAAPIEVSGAHPIELERIYVLQEVLGTGVGRALMTACLEAIREKGGDTVWLGVWENNLRAIRFYERFGFKIVGEKLFVLGREQQRDVVMVRTV